MGEVVFEAGQRWRERRGILLILDEKIGEHAWHAPREGNWTEQHLLAFADLEAPAPKPRQLWEYGNTCDEVEILRGDGDQLKVEDRYSPRIYIAGSVVEVARWLAERGYRCVSESCAEPTSGGVIKKASGFALLRCDGENWHEERSTPTGDLRPLPSIANAVAEIWTTPTREAGRRYVDIACNEIRGERYASAIRAALVAFSSDRADYGLRPVDIMAVIDACRVWEFNRSQLPFPNRKLTAAEVEQITKPTHLAAFARLSWARATVVAHLVADVYERARSAC